MKFTAIISEYNPFHNGHAYQINIIKKVSGPSCVIAVMSGNFTQRGEPALFDKWTRARLALLGGADIVIELPAAYALQSAEGFASGGVAIADGLAVVDELCFGSESADMDKLMSAARILCAEDARFKTGLKNALAKGKSFPAARMEAMQQAADGYSEVLRSPNDILAVEYLKALLRFGSAIQPKSICRTGSSYDAPDLSGSFSSAFSIRNAVKSGDLTGAFSAVPPLCSAYMKEFLLSGKPVFPDGFTNLLLYKLRSMTCSEIAAVTGVAEGLENKIKNAASMDTDYAGLIGAVKSKRYTGTRIARIFICCLLGITQEMVDDANSYRGLYARVLGYRQDALPAFSLLSKKSRIPVVTAGTQLPDNTLATKDILASDVYSLACAGRTAGSDYTQKLIVI